MYTMTTMMMRYIDPCEMHVTWSSHYVAEYGRYVCDTVKPLRGRIRILSSHHVAEYGYCRALRGRIRIMFYVYDKLRHYDDELYDMMMCTLWWFMYDDYVYVIYVWNVFILKGRAGFAFTSWLMISLLCLFHSCLTHSVQYLYWRPFSLDAVFMPTGRQGGELDPGP